MEWSEKSKYNSFNSYKGLAFYENYKQILKWMDGDDYLPPPIECNLDPIAYCNINCYFCIVQRYLKENPEEIGEMRKLPTDYALKLIDFLSEWGVKGLCISGGGEPTLHKGMEIFPKYALDRGMKASVFTNATIMNESLAISLLHCQWVAMSVDAGDRESYRKIKGKDLFNRVINNISYLASMRAKIGAKTNLCYKYLILPENIDVMYEACKIAKQIGIQDFHVRPVDLERSDIKNHRRLAIDKQKVLEQFEKCHELETDEFRVYTVQHKFDPDFHVMHNFTRCLASPLVIPILTDGNAYLCVDKKMEKPYMTGSCYPEPEKILDWWGSAEHRKLVKSVDINTCSRCTWGTYNQQMEKAVLEDNMCLCFP